MNNKLAYPVFALMMAVAFIIAVPKELYKKFLLYGLLFGGLGDTLIVILFS